MHYSELARICLQVAARTQRDPTEFTSSNQWGETKGMFQGHSATERGIASIAVVTSLLHRFVESGLLSRPEVLALLENTADELHNYAGHSHQKAAEIIRKEIAPKV
jgi:hypothetical protein